jgi:hypothetical protein
MVELRYGSMNNILQRYGSFPLTRSHVQKQANAIKANMLNGGCAPSRLFSSPHVEDIHVTPNNSVASTLTGHSDLLIGASSSVRATGGRPKGTTNAPKQEKEELLEKAIIEASEQLMEAWKLGRLPRGKFDEVLRDVELQQHLENNTLGIQVARLSGKSKW